MTDRRADDGTLHMADCPYTAGAGWCSECGRGDGERDCCCDALRACTVRVLGEAADRAKAALTTEVALYGEVFTDLKRGPLVHLDTVLDLISVEHQERMERLLDRLAQEAP